MRRFGVVDCGVRATTTCRSADWPRVRRTRFLCLLADPNETSEKDQLYSASVGRYDGGVKGFVGVQISVTRRCQEWLDACLAIGGEAALGDGCRQKAPLLAPEGNGIRCQERPTLSTRVAATDGDGRSLVTDRQSRDPCLVGLGTHSALIHRRSRCRSPLIISVWGDPVGEQESPIAWSACSGRIVRGEMRIVACGGAA